MFPMTNFDETLCNRHAIDFRSPILTVVAEAVLVMFMEPFSETLTGLRVPRNLLQGRGSILDFLEIIKINCFVVLLWIVEATKP